MTRRIRHLCAMLAFISFSALVGAAVIATSEPSAPSHARHSTEKFNTAVSISHNTSTSLTGHLFDDSARRLPQPPSPVVAMTPWRSMLLTHIVHSTAPPQSPFRNAHLMVHDAQPLASIRLLL